MTNSEKCTRCGNKYNPQQAQFFCPTGEPHLAPVKTYFIDDAPGDPGPFIMTAYGPQATGDNRKHSQTVMCNVVPEKTIVRDGSMQIVPGRNITFVRGVYSTELAEEQFYLDIKERNKILCSKERWEQVYLTEYQRLELDKQELAARATRVEQQENSLLERTKQQTQDRVPA